MIPWKHVPFESIENARDLGGYATADGGVTRYGVFLRSELPEHLTAADFERLRAYGVTRTVDLRSGGEAERQPSDLRNCPGIAYIGLPMFDQAAAAGSASQREKQPEPPREFQFPDWDVQYIQMMEEHRDWCCQVVKLMAEGEGCTHFHCFTGKDRTGICAAMLLSIAGVSEADICADYAMSMVYLTRRYDQMAKFMPFCLDADRRPDLISGFYSTSPVYMRRLLEHLDRTYGGMVAYLRLCGVSEETMDAIRRKLVEY